MIIKPQFGNPIYEPPSAAEFRTLLRRWRLTGAEAAALVALRDRQIRRYTGGDTPVPYAVLYTLASKCEGVELDVGAWRAQLRLKAVELECVETHKTRLRPIPVAKRGKK